MPHSLRTLEETLTLSNPLDLAVRFQRKRLYEFWDMQQLASAVLREEKPATSVDYWLKRAGLVPKGSTPRRAKYWHSHFEYFFLYCACRLRYENNNQLANRTYDELSNY